MVGFGGDLHGFIYGVIAVAWQQGFYSATGWQAQGVERGAARKYLFFDGGGDAAKITEHDIIGAQQMACPTAAVGRRAAGQFGR